MYVHMYKSPVTKYTVIASSTITDRLDERGSGWQVESSLHALCSVSVIAETGIIPKLTQSGPVWMIFIHWRKDRFQRTTPRHCNRSSFSSSGSTISCLFPPSQSLSLSLAHSLTHSLCLYLLCFPLTEVSREKEDSKA